MLCFICLLGPFAFFDVSKTKLLQLFTSALRWTSFISMIVLSIIRIAGGHHVTPVGANFAQIPNLFGVAVYSFMCQHSLPGKVQRVTTRYRTAGLKFSNQERLLMIKWGNYVALWAFLYLFETR